MVSDNILSKYEALDELSGASMAECIGEESKIPKSYQITMKKCVKAIRKIFKEENKRMEKQIRSR